MGNAIPYVQRFLGFKKENSNPDRQLPPTKTYSWDKRSKETEDRKVLLSTESQCDQTVHRSAGEINGNGPLVMENCTRCLITVLDHCDSVTVDGCEDCVFILGPVKGSIFMRNCHNCVIVAHCQQFRSRDCIAVKSFLFCATQPSIETSANMTFKDSQLAYPAFKEHLKMTGLDQCNNLWDQIHDFSPPESGKNWSILHANDTPEVYLNGEQLSHCRMLGIQFESNNEERFSLPSAAKDDISDKFVSLVGP